MGILANRAILKGRIVDYHTLGDSFKSSNACQFDYNLLNQLGFGDILSRLLNKSNLTHVQILALLSEASLPVLMKLVNICCQCHDYVAPVPVIALPLQRWIDDFGKTKATDLTLAYIENMQSGKIVLIVNELNYALLDEGLSDLISVVTKCIPDIKLVGPSPDDLVVWLGQIFPGEVIDFYVRKGSLYLARMKQLGFSSFRPVFREESVEVLASAGFHNTIYRTLIDQLTPAQFADELIRINTVASGGDKIHTWSPGLSVSRVGNIDFDHTDVQLLKALAVGSICLNSISFRRVSSRYFSLSAVEFSNHCGANDFGFGACNEITASELQLSTIERLMTVYSDKLEPSRYA